MFQQSDEYDASNLISHVLLAEFDVDEGSVMREQYPSKLIPPPGDYEIPYSELIANMMHPDGAQRQEWDHNYFLLHRPPATTMQDVLKEWEFLDDDYSESVDLSSLVHETPEATTLFAFNCILCLKDSTVKRGAVLRAICILSEYPAVCIANGWSTGLIPLLKNALLTTFEYEAESHRDILASLFTCLNSLSCKNSFFLLNDTPALAYSSRPYYLSSTCTFIKEQFTINIPSNPYTRQFSVGSITSLIRRLGINGVMQIFNAILLEKNILISGYGIVNHELCAVVLSCGLLVSPLMRRLLQQRVFPYVNLTDFSFAKVKGFIAGTTNPMMRESCAHDLFVDLSNNSISIVDKIPQKSEGRREKLRVFGKVFFEETAKLVQTDRDEDFKRRLDTALTTLRCDEAHVRRLFQEYTLMLVEICMGLPEIPGELFEQFNPHVNNIMHTIWFRDYTTKREAESALRKTYAGAIRRIWYPIRGYVPAKFRAGLICPALDQLIRTADSPKNLLKLGETLITYFGTVDLSDAIEYIRNDDELKASAGSLNSQLLTMYNNEITLSAAMDKHRPSAGDDLTPDGTSPPPSAILSIDIKQTPLTTD